MSNPSNKKTLEKFKSEINPELGITITGDYVNTNTKIEYTCKHGTRSARPWQILTFKNCCREGYYESGKMWAKRTVSLDQAKERILRDRQHVDVSECYFEKLPVKESKYEYKKVKNIRCTIHNLYYDSHLGKKMGMCPECYREENLEKILKAGPLAWASQTVGSFVSNAETKWLDSLNVPERQYWLSDVKYKVDGYDPETRTVYLYHGRFWHGCPETFDPEMIHPVVKLPMKDLFERTMMYENKIRQAGYNLVTQWGR